MGIRESTTFICFCDNCGREFKEEDEDYSFSSKHRKYFCDDGCEEEYEKDKVKE